MRLADKLALGEAVLYLRERERERLAEKHLTTKEADIWGEVLMAYARQPWFSLTDAVENADKAVSLIRERVGGPYR